MSGFTDLPVPPACWKALSHDDRAEYQRLRAEFHHGQKISSKDRRIVTFRRELNVVMKFLERGPENLENRSIVTGVCFAGRIVCVNTRQLKQFLNRCKSSINGSFQQLGYVALRTKAKARQCVINVLPALQNEQNILRQWTVRVVSEEAQFCFVSSFCNVPLPEINSDDLLDERKPRSANSRQPLFPGQTMGSVVLQRPKQVAFQHILGPSNHAPLKPKVLECDLPTLPEYDPTNDLTSFSFNTHGSSLSMECLTSFDDDWTMTDFGRVTDDDPWKVSFQRVFESKMPKSKSSGFVNDGEWSIFDGDF
jgi:hypothetical protein